MQQQPDHFRTLKILHLALLGGMTFFALIILVLVLTGEAVLADPSFDRVFQAVSAVLSLAALIAGFNIFKRRVAAIRSQDDTAEKKMEQYRAACILWWALIEGPGFFAIIGLFLTGNYVFLALALFHISLLAIFMPRKDNIQLLLNLSSEEVVRLEGKAF